MKHDRKLAERIPAQPKPEPVPVPTEASLYMSAVIRPPRCLHPKRGYFNDSLRRIGVLWIQPTPTHCGECVWEGMRRRV